MKSSSKLDSLRDNNSSFLGAFLPPMGIIPGLEEPQDTGRVAINIPSLIVCCYYLASSSLLRPIFAARAKCSLKTVVRLQRRLKLIVQEVACLISRVCAYNDEWLIRRLLNYLHCDL